MGDFRRCYTVWKFLSPTTGETVVKVHVSEPDDIKYQHIYQQILWRGLAHTPAEAEGNAAAQVQA